MLIYNFIISKVISFLLLNDDEKLIYVKSLRFNIYRINGKIEISGITVLIDRGMNRLTVSYVWNLPRILDIVKRMLLLNRKYKKEHKKSANFLNYENNNTSSDFLNNNKNENSTSTFF